ncbi:DUF4214 domain-containing protein [Cellulomonas marina]|uniref:DUF4214 domain-containing protein n=1 Tax=Cellulomonas marina TaxID=988821 RepID=A0A1I1A5R0_9CELL|nr:DUF4214 domain-containing protein [Cellulomonas marina]SFB33364.1 protein of unknown function [Cellulomonas marina]
MPPRLRLAPVALAVLGVLALVAPVAALPASAEPDGAGPPAVAGTSADVVATTPAVVGSTLVGRRAERRWTTAGGRALRAPRSATVQFALPEDLHTLPVAGPAPGQVRVLGGQHPTLEGARREDWTVVVDLPAALADLARYGTPTPSSVQVDVRLADATGSWTVDLVVDVVLEAATAPAVVDRALPAPDVVRDSAALRVPDVPYGTDAVLVAPPGTWTTRLRAPLLVQGWNVGGGSSETTLGTGPRTSPDGARLEVPTTGWQVGPPGYLTVEAALTDGTSLAVRAAVVATADSRARAYVRAVYLAIFRRDADEAGLDGWVHALLGGMTPSAVADGLTASDEFRTRLVRQAYGHYLGREPDDPGTAGWLRAMRSGMPIQQMESGFIAAPEYHLRAGGTDASWVRALYEDVLGRPARADEVQWWTAVTARADRSEVARGFLYSTEHLTDVVDGYYREYLHRPADPAGAAGWVRAIQAGERSERIIAGILASPEYRATVADI